MEIDEVLSNVDEKTIYYREANIAIINADSIEVMQKLPSECADLILTDPPYNVGQKFHNDNLSHDEYMEFMETWVSLSNKILKTGGAFFMFHYFLGMWKIKPILDKQGWKFLNLIIWGYPNLMPSNKTKKSRFPLSYQPLFFYGKNFTKDLVAKLYDLGEPERKDVWLETATQSNFINNFRHHPSCKPYTVVKKPIVATTEENDLVLDPFCGSGTTLVACKNFGRKGIGIEISRDYCEVAVQRLKQECLSFYSRK